MSGIIWHQLPKDLIKVICEFAKDNPQPTALSVFLANSDKINWGSLSRNPMSFSSNDALAVWHRQTCPNVDDPMASVNIVRVNWDLLSNIIRQEERQIKPVQTKHDALLMRLALLMQIKF